MTIREDVLIDLLSCLPDTLQKLDLGGLTESQLFRTFTFILPKQLKFLSLYSINMRDEDLKMYFHIQHYHLKTLNVLQFLEPRGIQFIIPKLPIRSKILSM